MDVNRKSKCYLADFSVPVATTKLVCNEPVQLPNKVTIALMTPAVHLGSKNLQEADDNHTTVLPFGVVQGCH